MKALILLLTISVSGIWAIASTPEEPMLIEASGENITDGKMVIESIFEAGGWCYWGQPITVAQKLRESLKNGGFEMDNSRIKDFWAMKSKEDDSQWVIRVKYDYLHDNEMQVQKLVTYIPHCSQMPGEFWD